MRDKIETTDGAQDGASALVTAHRTIPSMRNSGYKNLAYAFGALIDNSIQAGATQVELLCGEQEVELAQQRRLRIKQIGVLDNGSGMDADVLRIALQFGNGTHLGPEDQKGIGKFGMGLPNASISQCKRVDVWSWQDGPENALHTHIDIDRIKRQEQKGIPAPTSKEIPLTWRKVGQEFGKSGTLVVWSRLDRVMWKTARSIINHSELLVGRMYRRFLEDGRAKIIFHPFDLDKPEEDVGPVRLAEPNDPLYLTGKTSCPEPYADEPMFEMWGDGPVEKRIHYNGGIHPVKITFSVAREEARAGRNAGSSPYGIHAKKNMGVSIVRAGRELEMNHSWTKQYDPRERWWGVEIEFPPALDDLFGVTNNKQTARNLNKIDVGDLTIDGESPVALKDRMRATNDPLEPILDISTTIDKNLSVLRTHIKNHKRSKRTKNLL